MAWSLSVSFVVILDVFMVVFCVSVDILLVIVDALRVFVVV